MVFFKNQLSQVYKWIRQIMLLFSCITVISLLVLLQNDYLMTGSSIFVGAADFFHPRLLSSSFYSFLPFGRKKSKEITEKEVLQTILEDYQLQIRELQVLIFSLKTDKSQLQQQLTASKQTLQTLRKEKLSLQQSVEEEKKSLKEAFLLQKNQLIQELKQQKQQVIEEERKIFEEQFEKDKQKTIEALKLTHQQDLECKEEEITTIKTKYQKSLTVIEELKQQVLTKSNELKQSQLQSEEKQLEYVKTVDELKKKLRAQSLESKQSNSAFKEIKSNFIPSSWMSPSATATADSKEKDRLSTPPHALTNTNKANVSKIETSRRKKKSRKNQLHNEEKNNKEKVVSPSGSISSGNKGTKVTKSIGLNPSPISGKRKQ